MMFKKTFIMLVAILLLSLVPVANAAPSGTIYDPVGAVADNVLLLGGSEWVAINFTNTAGAVITDVASTVQNVTLAAANLNPSRTQIPFPYTAKWEIYVPGSPTSRASGSVVGSLDTSAIYAPYSTTDTVYLYTWAIPQAHPYTGNPGEQFENTLGVLRPGEILELNVTMKCQNMVGDSRIWFFFRATEAAYAAGNYPTDINAIPQNHRVNLYYSKLPGPIQTKYWLPLHNSYDPYDSDIGTGHNFDQLSWTRGSTTHAFAKGNKLVHQKPVEDPVDPLPLQFSLHICGFKFDDLNRNGIYDVETERGINGVTVMLLGPDKTTNFTDFYPEWSYVPPEDATPDVLTTGENQLAGSYCFNLVNSSSIVVGTSYTFYIKIVEPSGRGATTPTLIGPKTLVANAEGPRESLNNNFGNALPRPVGGVLTPVSKFAVLAPYLALVGLAGVASIVVAVKRRRKA